MKDALKVVLFVSFFSVSLFGVAVFNRAQSNVASMSGPESAYKQFAAMFQGHDILSRK